MTAKVFKLSQILKSLTADSPEELSLLQMILDCAKGLHARTSRDLSLSTPIGESTGGNTLDLPWEDSNSFLAMLPEESRRYLYGLVEALDIYESIHGHPVMAQSLTPTDGSVKQLRAIRDMCLEQGLRCVY